MRWIDIFFIVIFSLVQLRITILLLRLARGRALGRAAVVLLNVLLVIGYAFSFSQFLSAFHIPPRTTMKIGAGAIAFLVLATVVVLLEAILSAISRRLPAPTDPGRRRMLQTTATAMMSAPVVVLGYGAYVERRNFKVREIEIPLSGLPPDLDGLRLLQLTDIHLSAFLSEAEFAGVIDASNELRPHVALVTGDLISSHGDPLDACLAQLARLRSDAGIWGCLGNHERYAEVEDYTTEAGARRGMRFLRSQAQQLRFGNSTLNLAGVDYQRRADRKNYLAGAERMIVPGACNVLLSHNPDVFPAAVERGYNLLLAGHTHGGQVSIEILDRSLNPARFFTPYVYGLYRSGTAAAYVSRGIGTIGIPLRMGALPEISLLLLRRA